MGGPIGSTIGNWISGGGGEQAGRAIGGLFGDSATGASIGKALQKPLSWLANLLPFEDGTGMVKLYNPKTGALVHSMPLMEYRAMQKGGMTKKKQTKKTKKSRK